MKKILWLSNCVLFESETRSTGTWLHTMANEITKNSNIMILNVTNAYSIKDVKYTKYANAKQWILPKPFTGIQYKPNRRQIDIVNRIIREEKPDVVHIWGTENCWSWVSMKGLLETKQPLLEIQGLASEICKEYFSGLSLFEVMTSVGMKEVIRPYNSIIYRKMKAYILGLNEVKAICYHNNIGTQSEWTRSHVQQINPDAKLYHSSIGLRYEFYNSKKWSYDTCEPLSILFMASGLNSFKGLHVAVDAFAIVKRYFPNATLNVIGKSQSKKLNSGYMEVVLRRARRYQIEDSISWLGPQKSSEIVSQMLSSNVAVFPSFVESYCVSLKEALTVGLPCVVSYAGAMPELAQDGISALYYPPGDAAVCASKMMTYFSDRNLTLSIAEKLQSNTVRSEQCYKTQLDIYSKYVNNMRNKQ